MALIASETFTAADGTTLATLGGPIVDGHVPTAGGGISVQSNQLELVTGTNGGWANDDYAMARYTSTLTDSDTYYTFTLNGSGERYPRFAVRSAETTLRSGTFLHFWGSPWDGWHLNQRISYTDTDLGAYATTLAVDTEYIVRVRCVGTSIQCKVWESSVGEPSSWHIDTTTTLTSAGYLGGGISGNSGTTEQHMLLNDIEIYDAAGKPTVTPIEYSLSGLDVSGALRLNGYNVLIGSDLVAGSGVSLDRAGSTVTINSTGAVNRVVLSANVTNTTTTLANVSGLQLPTDLALGKYIIRGQLLLISDSTSRGCQVGMTGTGTQTGPAIRVMAQTTATANPTVRFFNFNAGTWGGTTTANATCIAVGLVQHAIIDGIITVSAAPTTFTGVTFKASSAGTVELKEGSYLEWEKFA